MAQLSEWKERKGHHSLIVQGARQVGKTYIIRQFAEENYPYSVYINFELEPESKSIFENDLSVDEIVRNISYRYHDVTITPGKTLLIFDEIQACPNARSSLKSFSDDGRYDVISSGSLLGIELADVPSLPVGHTETIHMYPMDFEEFLWAIGVSPDLITPLRDRICETKELGNAVVDQIMKYLTWYTLTGGMPEVVAEFSKDMKYDGIRRIQRRIVNDYRDDVVKYCENRLKPRTLGCLDSICGHLAKDNKRFNFSDVERSTTKRGMGYYGEAIEWLILAGVVIPCHRVSNPHMPLEESVILGESTDELDGSFKLYFLDTGLLLSMYDENIGIEILKGNIGVNRGALTENLVADMLCCQGRGLYYFEKVRDIELDFLLTIRGSTTAIEVKSGRHRTHRSLIKATERYGLKGMMFDTGDIRTDEYGIVHYPLFAAAFMDAIDPREEVGIDFDPSELDELSRALGVETPRD